MLDPFDEVLQDLTPNRECFSTIENGTATRSDLAKIREQCSENELEHALVDCILEGHLIVLHVLLDGGVRPNEDAVEAAARSGSFAVKDEELLASLLAKGADPNAVSNTAETPLSVAVREGSSSAIMLLLDAGGDVNTGNLLHCAVARAPSYGDTASVIDLLILRGSRVDAIEFEDPRARQLRHAFTRGTALHNACAMKNLEATEVLLSHGANPHADQIRDSSEVRCTPLDIAKGKCDKNIIALLEHEVGEIDGNGSDCCKRQRSNAGPKI